MNKSLQVMSDMYSDVENRLRADKKQQQQQNNEETENQDHMETSLEDTALL